MTAKKTFLLNFIYGLWSPPETIFEAKSFPAGLALKGETFPMLAPRGAAVSYIFLKLGVIQVFLLLP